MLLQAVHIFLTQLRIKLSEQEIYLIRILSIKELSFARIIKCMPMVMKMIKLIFMI